MSALSYAYALSDVSTPSNFYQYLFIRETVPILISVPSKSCILTVEKLSFGLDEFK